VWDLRQGSEFYTHSEGKQHELSDAQWAWLSKLVFLVDVIAKINYLNASLQAGLQSRCHKELGVSGRVVFLRTLEVGFFYPTA